MKTLMIIPTYNERENIEHFLKGLRENFPNVEALVVDDNSPDGTHKIVAAMQSQDPKLHLLLREKKAGLGRAYLAGFAWALENNYEVIGQMDADFSHRFEDLKGLLAEIPNYDFCTGSRWVPGGSTLNWSALRKLISHGGSFYSRMILRYPWRDWTGGFNIWKANTLRSMELNTIVSNGYGFQIELKYRALRKGFKGKEVPILFEDRRVGQSKMSKKIVLEALGAVWKFRTWSPH